MASFLGTLKLRWRVISRHPSLILSLPKGEVEVGRRHMAIELEKTRALYDECTRAGLDDGETFEAFFGKICHGNSYLYALVRRTRSSTVVETGVRRGESSAFILKALSDEGGGKLFSIDLPNASPPGGGTDSLLPRGAETGYLVPQRLRAGWDLTLGDAKVELPKLFGRLESADLFHHDSDHSYAHVTFELETAWPRCRNIACDDIDDNSAFDDFCSKVGVPSIKVRGSGVVLKPP